MHIENISKKVDYFKKSCIFVKLNKTNMSEPKIYVGKGKASKYGVKISVCLNDLPKEYINEFNGKKYINLEVTEMRTPDKYGKTHAVTVDTWKPEPKDDSVSPTGNDLPF